MTREIKFRGYSEELEKWCFGSLVDYGGGRMEIHGFDVFRQGDDSWHEIPVASRTVGQYICRKDNQGKEVYEGDIVILKEYKNDAFGLFDRTELSELSLEDIKGKLERKEEGIMMRDGPNMYFQDFRDGCWTDVSVFCEENKKITQPLYECEVIGNIHDNHELMKGGEL